MQTSDENIWTFTRCSRGREAPAERSQNATTPDREAWGCVGSDAVVTQTSELVIHAELEHVQRVLDRKRAVVVGIGVAQINRAQIIAQVFTF